MRDRPRARVEALHAPYGPALERLLDKSANEDIRDCITDAMDSWSEALERFA